METIQIPTENYQERDLVNPNPVNLKREITISPLDYGYVVRVGCQTVATENVEKLIEKLGAYLRNPVQAEKEYASKTFLN